VDEGNFVTMKGREYLLKEKFNKVYAIATEHGGEYVSQGKLSHFRFDKKSVAEKPSHQSRDTLIRDAIAYFEHGIEKLKETQK